MSKPISHKLGDVARREFGIEINKEHQKRDWPGVVTRDILDYAAEDSRILLPLSKSLREKIDGSGLSKTMEIEHRALPAIVWMSGAGVPFDVAGWRERLKEIEAVRVEMSAELEKLALQKPGGGTWNWNSHSQVKEAFGLVGITLEDTKADTIFRHSHPLAKALLNYFRASRMTSTYGRGLLDRVEGGLIYPSWHQLGAATGRMACSSPNLQQLPPEVRRYVRVPEGRVLIRADYSQIELRIAAKISGDKRMLQAYENEEDIHTITARSLTGREEVTSRERKLAKAVNFGLLYGMGSKRLREYARFDYGIEMTIEEAEGYRRRFFETYPGIKAWHAAQARELKRGNTETRTLTGRRRLGVEKFTDRLNSPVQGTGADGLKLALALLHERCGEFPGAIPILAVRDEIVVECDAEEEEYVAVWLEKAMVDGMEEALGSEGAPVPVVVEVEVSGSWSV